MMKNYNEILKKYELKPISYLKNGRILIIKTKDKKYVLKEKINNPLIYSYLESRSFNHFPSIIGFDDTYEISEYLDELELPEEQKMEELMKLVALLHSKTTYYEKTSLAYSKEIYETLENNIEYLKSYYEDIISLIDNKEFMSPSEYLFARNFTIIMDSLMNSQKILEEWYKEVENIASMRIVVLHNNLCLEHFVYNKKKALLSWRKAKFGSPIFDLVSIFNRYGMKYNFNDELSLYESIYPLKKEEKKLLYVFMLIPPKIEFNSNEYDLCTKLTEKIELLYYANKIVLPDEFKNREKNNQDKNKNHEDTKFS